MKRNGTYPGAVKMPHIVAAAPGDIRHRLWTLYWLTRFLTDHKDSQHRAVELGVRGGDSTRAILSALEDVGEGTLFSYDIEDCQRNVRDWTRHLGIYWPQANWAFSQKDSVAAAGEWQGGLVDFVFVDTDHTFDTTRREIDAWNVFVRPGGAMIFHDYWLQETGRDGVKPAVDQFFGTQAEQWVLECHDAARDGDTGFAILWKR